MIPVPRHDRCQRDDSEDKTKIFVPGQGIVSIALSSLLQMSILSVAPISRHNDLAVHESISIVDHLNALSHRSHIPSHIVREVSLIMAVNGSHIHRQQVQSGTFRVLPRSLTDHR
jgi:hypothetical protein